MSAHAGEVLIMLLAVLGVATFAPMVFTNRRWPRAQSNIPAPPHDEDDDEDADGRSQ